MATQYFGGNNLSGIGIITAAAAVLAGGLTALFGNFTSVQAIYTSSTNMYASNIVATSSAILPSNTTIDAKNVCLADGTNCSSMSTPSLAQVTAVGATSSQDLALTGGSVGTPGLSITNGGGNQSGIKLASTDSSLYGVIDWVNDIGSQAQMLMAGSAFNFGIFTENSASFYNYSGSMMNIGTVSGAVNLFAGGYGLTDIRLSVSSTGITAKAPITASNNNLFAIGGFDSAFAGIYASSTSYFSNVSSSALTVGEKNVCLADGTNCPAGSGSQTLSQVTALGASATATLQLLGGFIGASSTVTSTFTVLGGFNFKQATGTNVTTTALSALYVSSTNATTSILTVSNSFFPATTTMNGSFYANTGTAALPSVSLKGDRDTGLYSAAANQIGVTAGGSASLLISSSAVSAGSNNTRTLGTQAVQWTTIFGTSVSSTYSTSTVAVIGSSLYPSANNAASIGTSVRSFANIFASGTINGVNVTSTGVAIDFPGIGAPAATSDLVCWTATTGRLTHQATNCTVSSIRFKEYVTGLKPSDMMEIARKLRAVQYMMKEDGKAQQGFIAEEIAMVDPFLVVWEEANEEMKAEVLANYPNFKFLVKEGKEFTPRTVDYARVSVILSGAVNDLDHRLTELETRVSFLEYLWNAVRSLFK